MNFDNFAPEHEQPLEQFVANGGFCSIFRRIGCIGDSLSSGEFESVSPTGEVEYHDFYDYSWGQFLGRLCGSNVNNFSRGGMTAREYCQSFAQEQGFWNPELRCQAYFLALGVNDLFYAPYEFGGSDDICLSDWRQNRQTFAGCYAQIIQRLQSIEPRAHFFLITIPRSDEAAEREALADRHQALLREMTGLFPNCWLLDLRRFAPIYDSDFRRRFYLGGHMNPCGYVLTAKMISSYVDYIIRHNIAQFAETGFIGTPYRFGSGKTDV